MRTGAYNRPTSFPLRPRPSVSYPAQHRVRLASPAILADTSACVASACVTFALDPSGETGRPSVAPPLAQLRRVLAGRRTRRSGLGGLCQAHRLRFRTVPAHAVAWCVAAADRHTARRLARDMADAEVFPWRGRQRDSAGDRHVARLAAVEIAAVVTHHGRQDCDFVSRHSLRLHHWT